ncbi:MAG: hypothetical protein ACRECT_01010 [Thermoplasmata archaeon]
MTFGYVGPELAGILRRPERQIVEHQLAASLTDLPEVRRLGLRLSKLLTPRADVTVKAEGESIRFVLGAEDALDDGLVDRHDLAAEGNMTNMPPGYYAREISGPSLTGTARLHAPVPRIGTIADLRLEFDHGRITNWSSEVDPRWLTQLVKTTPKRRRRLTAVAIGLNPSLREGYGQDRLMEGAVTFYGMFQGTTHRATLAVNGRVVVDRGSMVHP